MRLLFGVAHVCLAGSERTRWRRPNAIASSAEHVQWAHASWHLYGCWAVRFRELVQTTWSADMHIQVPQAAARATMHPYFSEAVSTVLS